MNTTTPAHRAEELVGQAAYLISHELRTPLAVIVGYAELLAERDDAQTRIQAAAEIRRAAGRLSRMIDDLLAAAALEAKQLIVDAEPVELRTALDDALARLDADGESVRVSCSSLREVVVRADPVQLHQMLTAALAIASTGGAALEASLGEEDGFGLLTLTPISAPRDDDRAAVLALSVAQRLSELGGGSLSLAAEDLVLRLPLAGAGASS